MVAHNKNYLLNDKFPKQIKNATSTSDGLMSAEDKRKLDNINKLNDIDIESLLNKIASLEEQQAAILAKLEMAVYMRK